MESKLPINQLIENLPGFDSFSESDIEFFLNESKQFSLKLKKQKGNGILYGLDVAQARQQLFNQLPKEKRVLLLKEKCKAKKIKFIENEQVEECIDIGMGTSVYKIVLSSGQTKVLKEVENDMSLVFNHLCQFLDFPCINISLSKNEYGRWEMYNFIPGPTLQEVNEYDENMINEMAKQAALGDIVGRGDRHLENYVFYKKHIYAIDVSVLFWPDNESWLERYVKGGQAEICCCIHENKAQEQKNLKTFINIYEYEHQKLLKKKGQIKDFLISIDDMKNKLNPYSFIEGRCTPAYGKNQIENYLKNYNIYKQRVEYKYKLNDLVKRKPEILKKDPWLNMYYQANKQRLAAFFLIDFFERNYLLDQINQQL